MCIVHNSPIILSTRCIHCQPSLIIKTVDPTFALTTPTPLYCEVIFHSELDIVIIDKLNEHIDRNEYINVINNQPVLLGGGGDDDNNDSRFCPPIKMVQESDSEIRVFITPPKLRAGIGPYLHSVKDEIYRQILSNNLLDRSTSYKVFITAFSKYYKSNSENLTVFGGIHHQSSSTDIIHANSGALDHPFLEFLIRDITNVQVQQQSNMTDSNWVYLGTAQIVITFIKLLGKPVFIKDFIPYPKVRGRDSVINIYNHRPQNGITDISPCIVTALRTRLLLSDPSNIHRDEDLKYLSGKRNCKISKKYWSKLSRYPIKLPQASVITGEFIFEHFSLLEKAVKFPICVHYLKPSKSKGGDVNLECLRAPSQQALQASSLNSICHLLMLNSSHVCYIPDIHSYMQSAFKNYSKFRCMFCYTFFPSESGLKNHLDDCTCYSKKHQPAKMVLEEDAFIPHQDLISEMCPEQIIVADCEAMLSKDPIIQNENSSDSDSDDHENTDDVTYLEGSDRMVDSAIHKERPPGKINSHIPHAIGLLSLNHKFEYQEYKHLWG